MEIQDKLADENIKRRLLNLLRLSVVVAMGFSVYSGEIWPFLYSLLALGLMYLPEMIKSKVNINLPIEYDIVLVIFMYMAVFLGKAGQAYDHFWWWDLLLHTSSGFIIGFIAFLILYINVRQGRLKASQRVAGLLIFSVGLAFGAVWEIFEYGLALVFGGNLTAAGLRDTIGDLIVDGIGAAIMAVIGMRQIFSDRQSIVLNLAKKFIRLNPRPKRSANG